MTKDEAIKRIAIAMCFPCDFEYDGRCLEGKKPSECYIALQTATKAYEICEKCLMAILSK